VRNSTDVTETQKFLTMH